MTCPACGEDDDLAGDRADDEITITCGRCGHTWRRPTTPVCRRCGATDLEPVPLAIVERSRGTQLSVVGIRTIHLCPVCDEAAVARWQRNRPNPLMPDELPTVGPEKG